MEENPLLQIKKWREAEHPARREAVARTRERTPETPGRYTEEALAFAVNQQMHQLRPEALRAWIGSRRAVHPQRVGVYIEGGGPLGGVRPMLAAALLGHRVVGAAPPDAPYLLPAFFRDVQEYTETVPVRFVEAEALPGDPRLRGDRLADALVARADEAALDALRQRARGAGLPKARCFLRPRRYGAAVLDGSETPDEREGLAEDMLLYDGQTDRSVRLLWAPEGLPPDPYLEAMAAFRGVFPAHPALPGALEMQRAFLEAAAGPHAYGAYGDGPSFLVSRGAPEVQPGGHIRWAKYEALDAVRAWLAEHAEAVECIVARAGLHDRLPAARYTPPVLPPVLPPGRAHRMPLGAGRDEAALLGFVERLGR